MITIHTIFEFVLVIAMFVASIFCVGMMIDGILEDGLSYIAGGIVGLWAIWGPAIKVCNETTTAAGIVLILPWIVLGIALGLSAIVLPTLCILDNIRKAR